MQSSEMTYEDVRWFQDKESKPADAVVNILKHSYLIPPGG